MKTSYVLLAVPLGYTCPKGVLIYCRFHFPIGCSSYCQFVLTQLLSILAAHCSLLMAVILPSLFAALPAISRIVLTRPIYTLAVF